MPNLAIIIIEIILIVLFFAKIEHRIEKDRKIKSSHAYISRVSFGTVYLLIGISLLYFIIKKDLIYTEIRNNITDLPRFIWCLSWSFVGFFMIALQSRFNEKLPYFPYILFYPFPLFIIASLVYSILSINDATRGHVFYPFSLALCGTLSFLVDYYWQMFRGITDKIVKK